MGLLTTDEFAIASGSPERLFSLKNDIITTRPIAGTKKRGVDIEEDNRQRDVLRSCVKENAEHVMLVDLARNDMSRNAENVTVEVFKEIQYYSHVIHLVSKVTGTVKKDSSVVGLRQILFRPEHCQVHRNIWP